MSRRSKSVDAAVLRAIRDEQGSIADIHDWIDHRVGRCAENEVIAALRRLVKRKVVERDRAGAFRLVEPLKDEER